MSIQIGLSYASTLLMLRTSAECICLGVVFDSGRSLSSSSRDWMQQCLCSGYSTSRHCVIFLLISWLWWWYWCFRATLQHCWDFANLGKHSGICLHRLSNLFFGGVLVQHSRCLTLPQLLWAARPFVVGNNSSSSLNLLALSSCIASFHLAILKTISTFLLQEGASAIKPHIHFFTFSTPQLLRHSTRLFFACKIRSLYSGECAVILLTFISDSSRTLSQRKLCSVYWESSFASLHSHPS